MLVGPREEDATGAATGGWDCGTGGVANRGGLLPSDSFKAEDKAEAPGPGSDDCSTRPASGVCDESSRCAGVGIWRTAGVPACKEATGEPSRAIESAREIECESAGELRPDSRDDARIARALDGSGELSTMMSWFANASPTAQRAPGLPAHNEVDEAATGGNVSKARGFRAPAGFGGKKHTYQTGSRDTRWWWW